jgi:hypothetical protein
MKPDTLKKKKLIVALAMLCVSVLLLYRSLQTAPPEVKATIAVPTADPASKVQPRSEHRYIAVLLKPTLDPRLRLDLLAESEGVVYKGAGRNIFVEHQEDIPQTLTPVRLPEKQQPEAPPTLPPLPSPPPIDLKAWGWVNHGGGDRTVFLAQGDNGFVAHEGDIVARRYKVVKIGPSSVEIEDLLSNNRQTIPVSF